MSSPSLKITMNAVAGANYGSDDSNIGEAVYVSNTNEVTVCTATTQEAIGIIVDAQDATAGWVEVCIFGLCKARAGAANTIGTTTRWSMPAADGRLDPYAGVIPSTVAQQTEVLGFFLPNRSADLADGDLADFFVLPQIPNNTAT